VSRTAYASRELEPRQTRRVTLLDLLDRLLAGGVVVHGHITLAAADVDLVELDLAVLVAATQRLVDE
jgi:Gas vesicle protein